MRNPDNFLNQSTSHKYLPSRLLFLNLVQEAKAQAAPSDQITQPVKSRTLITEMLANLKTEFQHHSEFFSLNTGAQREHRVIRTQASHLFLRNPLSLLSERKPL